jgi:hypothetical protein
MITSRYLFLMAAAVAICSPLGPVSAQPNSDPVVFFHDGFENIPGGVRSVAVPPYTARWKSTDGSPHCDNHVPVAFSINLRSTSINHIIKTIV